MQIAAYGCEPLYPSLLLDRCKSNLETFSKSIEDEKPDFVFIFTRWVWHTSRKPSKSHIVFRHISIGEPFASNVTSFEEDFIYQTMKRQMLKYIKNIKYKLYILDAIPRNHNIVSKIAPMLKSGVDPVKIDVLMHSNTFYNISFWISENSLQRRVLWNGSKATCTTNQGLQWTMRACWLPPGVLQPENRHFSIFRSERVFLRDGAESLDTAWHWARETSMDGCL